MPFCRRFARSPRSSKRPPPFYWGAMRHKAKCRFVYKTQRPAGKAGLLPYKIKFLATDINKGINISSILAIPLLEDINSQFVVESNNLESENLQEILEQGVQTGIRLAQYRLN